MYIEKYIPMYRKLFIEPKMNRRKCNEESLKFSSIAIPNGIFYIEKQLEFNRNWMNSFSCARLFFFLQLGVKQPSIPFISHDTSMKHTFFLRFNSFSKTKELSFYCCCAFFDILFIIETTSITWAFCKYLCLVVSKNRNGPRQGSHFQKKIVWFYRQHLQKTLHEIFSSMNIDLCKPMLKCSSLSWEKAFSVLGGSTDIEIEVCIKAFFRSIFSFFSRSTS